MLESGGVAQRAMELLLKETTCVATQYTEESKSDGSLSVVFDGFDKDRSVVKAVYVLLLTVT